MAQDLQHIVAARNLVRPFFNLQKPKAYWKNLQGVRTLTTSANVDAICALIENKPHFPFPGLGNTFPQEPAEIPLPKLRRLAPLSDRREWELQLGRLRQHAGRLTEALSSLAEINSALASVEYEGDIGALISAHTAKYGWSLIILKKYLAGRLISGGLSALNATVREITQQHENNFWGIYCHFLYDMVDPTFDPSSAYRQWLKMSAAQSPDQEWYSRIFSADIRANLLDPRYRSDTLLRLSTCSLLDATLFLWHHSRADQDIFIQRGLAFPSPVAEVLEDHFGSIKVSPPTVYLSPAGGISDAELFRLSFIFSDVWSVAEWRSSLNSLILPSTTMDTARPDNWAKALHYDICRPELRPAEVAALVEQQRDWQRLWICDQVSLTNQELLQATILARALEINSGALGSDRAGLAEALASVSDILDYTSTETLSALISADDDHVDILDFILRDLIFRHHRSRDNDLERRLSLMKLVQDSGEESLGAYVRSLSGTHPLAAKRVASSSTRLFLERLFLLMSSIADVLKTRVEICEWLLDQDGGDVDSLSEEIASLKRELANLDTRSDLDSTRIHVDEDSLREWFSETQRSALARYIQTVVAEGPSVGSESLLRYFTPKERHQAEDEVKIDSQVGSEFLLLGIFSATLKAFVGDKSFGLDAYLSRRIRHGTLSGSIMTPLARVTRQIEENEPVANLRTETGETDFADLANTWRRSVGQALDDARKHVIQLHSETQNRGLIRADWRTAANIQHLDATLSRIKSRVLESKGTYDVFSDLYALCWDCIEPDLAQLRRFLLRDLLPSLSTQLLQNWDRLDGRGQAIAKPFVAELFGSLQKKIHEVCGWFIRPVFRRDSYSLKMLVSSTMSIVHELDESYSFEEHVEVPENITLNRASFDVFGDLLFVVLGNAAKYGTKDRPVRVVAEISDAADQMESIIMVEIQSFVSDLEAHQHAVSRIRAAMSSQEAIARAAVGEGFSGLGKAVGIINNIRTGTGAIAFYADEPSLEIRFAIYLPAEIAANRSQ